MAFRELDITATDLSSQVLSDVLTRIPGLTWLAAGQLDGMTDEVNVWLVLGLNRGRGHFLNFLVASMILLYNAKSVFLAVNASLRWLNNVSGVYLVQVSLILIGQRGIRYQPLLPIGWRTVQIVRQRKRKIINTAPTTLSAILAASAIHFYQCTNILH